MIKESMLVMSNEQGEHAGDYPGEHAGYDTGEHAGPSSL